MKLAKDCFYSTATPNERGDMRPEIALNPTETNGKQDDQKILCGYVPVVLMKLFGPLIFCDLRIRANAEACEWIIERQSNCKWVEVARIPGQLDEDFTEE